jgi:hypothetical protein
VRITRALLLAAGLFAPACSLLLNFEGRAGETGGAGGAIAAGGGGVSTSSVTTGPGGSDAGYEPEAAPITEAFELTDCAPTIASPLAKQACDYRDDACAGFADLSEAYVEKGSASSTKTAFSCGAASLVAFEWSAPNSKAELRVLGRARSDGAGCDTPEAGQAHLTMVRLDAQSLAAIEEREVTLLTDGAPTPEPSGIAFGRSERRVVLAYTATDLGTQTTRLHVLVAPIDAGGLAEKKAPSVLAFRHAARLVVPSTFVPSFVTAVDQPALGKVLVAVEDAGGGPAMSTLADESVPEEVPYSEVMVFSDGTATATAERLFPRSQIITTDAGDRVGQRVDPSAMTNSKTGLHPQSNAVTPGSLSSLRYLVVAGATGTIASPSTWITAAPLIPKVPGAGFGEQPVYTRLDVFSIAGRSYAELRGCTTADHSDCVITASVKGGNGTFDAGGVASCDQPVALTLPTDAGVDAKGIIPPMHALCAMGSVTLARGALGWHREAGPLGAVIEAGGAHVWLVRPGEATSAGGKAKVRLATKIDPGATLADLGPVGASFVSGQGWVVTALDRATGHLWARRYGCASLP